MGRLVVGRPPDEILRLISDFFASEFDRLWLLAQKHDPEFD
jgi:hypothetical protein